MNHTLHHTSVRLHACATTNRRHQRRSLTRTRSLKAQPPVASWLRELRERCLEEWNRVTTIPCGTLSPSQLDSARHQLAAIRAVVLQNRPRLLPQLCRNYTEELRRRSESTSAELDLSSLRLIDLEYELLQQLEDITVFRNSSVNTSIRLLEPSSLEHETLVGQIMRSHSWRHSFCLRVGRIFALHIPAERERFHLKGEPIGDVRRLYHGTTVGRLPGILINGLRPASNNAPTTCAPFGNGVHLTDESSVAALAFYKNNSNEAQLLSGHSPHTGYIVVADAALGTIKRELLPVYRTKAPTGYDSVQGVKNRCLPHNTHVLYSPAQCTVQYIVEVCI